MRHACITVYGIENSRHKLFLPLELYYQRVEPSYILFASWGRILHMIGQKNRASYCDFLPAMVRTVNSVIELWF